MILTRVKILAMAALALGILPPALLKGDHLRSARVLNDLARDTRAFDKRGSQRRCSVTRQHENMIECHGIPGLARECHDGDRVPGGDVVLLAPGFDNCEQLGFPRVSDAL